MKKEVIRLLLELLVGLSFIVSTVIEIKTDSIRMGIMCFVVAYGLMDYYVYYCKKNEKG